MNSLTVALDHLPVGVMVVRCVDGRCEYANARLLALVGSPLVDKAVDGLLDSINDEATTRTLRNAIESGQATEVKGVSMRSPVREPGRHEAPRPLYCDISCLPIPDDAAQEGRPARMSISVYDVSDLTLSGRVKNESIGVVAHEFRNYLAPILNAVRLLRTKGASASGYELDVIERQGGQLADLVDDLIDEVRLSTGKFTLTRRPVELRSVVSLALETAAPMTADHQLTVSVPEQGLLVSVDQDRLAQAIANIVGNAAKFTPAGGSITVTGRRTDASVELSVRDSGIGIEPSVLPRIFDVFVQGRRQTSGRAAEGLGFGLAIVSNVVALHGGQVSAHSDGRGRGTTITMTIPAAPEGVRPEPSHDAPSAGPHELTAPRMSGLRVLVVDDNRDNATIVAASLETLGYEARQAHDGSEAVAVTRVFQPHVVVLDIGLPGLDGYDVATRLRRESKTGDVMFIALTGYSQEADLDRAEEEGFDGYFVKPADVARIDALIQNARQQARTDTTSVG